MKEYFARDADEGTSMEEDEYAFLFAMRDLAMEAAEKLAVIHGRRPESMDRVLNLIEEEVQGLLSLF